MEDLVYTEFYRLEKEHWWFKGMQYLYEQTIKKIDWKDKYNKMLDMGCGTGELTLYLKSLGKTYAADYSGIALDFCKKRGLSSLVRTSAEQAGFKSNSFTLVVASGLIEHLEKDDDFLREMHRVLSEQGYLVILTSAFRFLWSSHDDMVHHKRRYTVEKLKEIINSNGFQIKKISYVNFFLFLPILAVRIFQRLFKMQVKKKSFLDVIEMPLYLKVVLYKILQFESGILKYMSLPFGVGIFCVMQRKSNFLEIGGK